MSKHRSIVIVGGGFAGTALARAMAGRLPADTVLTLLSEESYTTFNPLLPEAVGASIFPEQVVAPLREVLRLGPMQNFIMARVLGVDSSARTVRYTCLAGIRELRYEHLVLALGNRAKLDLIDGMAEHTLPLKTVGDAMEIRNTVLRRVARIELETDPALRSALGHFVVIGGGFSGVEVAGELVDCLRSIARYYPRVALQELQVSVLQDRGSLLPELPPAMGLAALKSLRQRGVHVRMETRATGVSAQAVRLSTGETLAAHTVISTIGTQPNALLAESGWPLERGRVAVAPDCSVPGHPGMWAVGDCALVPNARDGMPAPPTAQFAVREGLQLANNLLRVLRGEPTRPFAHKSLGDMASIGHMKGVAQVCGVPLSGLPAWLLWRAFYLSQMPTLRRKLRIFVEWTWGMFFPADITHLRFTGSQAQAKSEAADRTRAASSLPRGG